MSDDEDQNEVCYLAREIAILERFGPDADSNAQREHRRRLYDDHDSLFPAHSTVMDTAEGDRWIPGKDHWLDFARFVIACIDAYRSGGVCAKDIRYDEIVKRYKALGKPGLDGDTR